MVAFAVEGVLGGGTKGPEACEQDQPNRSLWSRLGIGGVPRGGAFRTPDSEPRPQGAVAKSGQAHRLIILKTSRKPHSFFRPPSTPPSHPPRSTATASPSVRHPLLQI